MTVNFVYYKSSSLWDQMILLNKLFTSNYVSHQDHVIQYIDFFRKLRMLNFKQGWFITWWELDDSNILIQNINISVRNSKIDKVSLFNVQSILYRLVCENDLSYFLMNFVACLVTENIQVIIIFNDFLNVWNVDNV